MIVTNGTNNIFSGCFPGTNQAQNGPASNYQQEFASRCVAQIKEHRAKMSQPGDEIRFIVPSATQSGKTGAMILECLEYRKRLIQDSLEEDFMIIFLSFSARDVNDQTITDFVTNDLADAIKTHEGAATHNNYVHPGNINTASTSAILARVEKIRANGGHIIWINDEADHSTGGKKDKNGEFFSKLREFVKQRHIPLFDIQPPAGRKSWEVGFHITASLAHLLPIAQNRWLVPSMRVEYFELDPGYSGLDTLDDRGFFRDNKAYLGTRNRSELEKLMLERMDEDLRGDDPLYHLVRSQDTALRKSLKSAWENKGGVVYEYDCSGRGDKIRDLSEDLDEKPDVPTLIFLKQGFSRGSRIHTVDHIGTMFDNKKDNDAAVIQSFAGRMTGRTSASKRAPNPRPSRESSYHPRLEIYCDTYAVNKELPVIEAQRADSGVGVIELLRKTYPGMSGTHARQSRGKTRSSYMNGRVLVVSDTLQDHQNEVGKLGQLTDTHGTNVSMSTNTMSKNIKDLAGEYLKNPGRYHPAENGNGKAYIAVHADGPGRNPSCMKSWNALDPSHRGKYIIVEVNVVQGPGYIYNHGID